MAQRLSGRVKDGDTILYRGDIWMGSGPNGLVGGFSPESRWRAGAGPFRLELEDGRTFNIVIKLGRTSMHGAPAVEFEVDGALV